MSNDYQPTPEQNLEGFTALMEVERAKIAADPMLPDGASKAAREAQVSRDLQAKLGITLPDPNAPKPDLYGFNPEGVAPRIRHDGKFLDDLAQGGPDRTAAYHTEVLGVATALGWNSDTATYVFEQVSRLGPAVKAMPEHRQREHFEQAEQECERFFKGEAGFKAAQQVARTYLESANTPLAKQLANSRTVMTNVQLLVEFQNLFERRAAFNRAKNSR